MPLPYQLPFELGLETNLAPAPSILPRTFAGTLARLCTNVYTVTRAGAGSYDTNGRFTAPSVSTFQINASIQPTAGRDLMRLPEGLRTQELISVWSLTPLQTASAPASNQADIISYGGLNYQVQTVLDWSESGGFGKYIAQKVGQ
jgi:hypothetical protein